MAFLAMMIVCCVGDSPCCAQLAISDLLGLHGTSVCLGADHLGHSFAGGATLAYRDARFGQNRRFAHDNGSGGASAVSPLFFVVGGPRRINEAVSALFWPP